MWTRATSEWNLPFVCCATKGQLEIVRLLLQANAEKDKARHSGTTPVYIAAQNGQLEVVWLFAGCQCGSGQGPPEWQNRVVNRSCGWSFGDHPLFAGAHNMDKIKAVNDGAD